MGVRLLAGLLAIAVSAQVYADVPTSAPDELELDLDLSPDADADAAPPPAEPVVEVAAADAAPVAAPFSRASASRLRPRGPTPATVISRTLGLYGASTLALSPIWEPGRLDRALAAIAVPAGARRGVVAVGGWLHRLRTGHTLACLLSHEVLTDVTSDLMAQAIGARQAALGAPMAVDWQRVPRSTAASLLSDDFPFLIWSKYLWDVVEALAQRLRASAAPRWLVHVATARISVALLKTAVTQLVYETTSNAAYLSMQALFRGGGRREIAEELNAKFWSVWKDGLVFWTGAHMVVFLMPIWWLQPIADNLFTLAFNTYLSIRAYEDDD